MGTILHRNRIAVLTAGCAIVPQPQHRPQHSRRRLAGSAPLPSTATPRPPTRHLPGTALFRFPFRDFSGWSSGAEGLRLEESRATGHVSWSRGHGSAVRVTGTLSHGPFAPGISSLSLSRLSVSAKSA
eukprot:3941200-Rhodomonas_salina.1